MMMMVSPAKVYDHQQRWIITWYWRLLYQFTLTKKRAIYTNHFI